MVPALLLWSCASALRSAAIDGHSTEANPAEPREDARAAVAPEPEPARLRRAAEERLGATLGPWRAAIEAARRERAQNGEQAQTYGEEGEARAFQGTLEEAELIRVEWVHPWVALAQFDSDPEQTEYSCFGGCDAGLVGTQEAFLIGPDKVVALDGLTSSWDSDCRNWGENKHTLAGDSRGLGGRIVDADEGDTNVVFTVVAGELFVGGADCVEVERVSGACGESFQCVGTALAPEARTTLAVINEDQSCLESLRRVEHAIEESRASRSSAPHRFASAHLEPGDGQQCAAPPRAARLRARRSIAGLRVGREASGALVFNEAEWNDDVSVEFDIPPAEFGRWWSRVRFSCPSPDGFAVWLRSPNDTDTRVYWIDEGAQRLFEDELAETRLIVGQTISVRRIDHRGDGRWSWFVTSRFAAITDAFGWGVCDDEEVSCHAELVGRDGTHPLSCEATFIRTESGVRLLWDPGDEDHEASFAGWHNGRVTVDHPEVEAFAQLVEMRDQSTELAQNAYAELQALGELSNENSRTSAERREVEDKVSAALSAAGVVDARDVIAELLR